MAPSTSVRCEVEDLVRGQWRAFDRDGPSHNFPVDGDVDGFFAALYDRFVEAARAVAGPFDLAPDNSAQAWALCIDRDTPPLPFHHHLRTAHVNGVYYLRIPESGPDEGGLLLREGPDGEVRIRTVEDELLVFDASVAHAPQPVTSAEPRISINVELRVTDPRSVRQRLLEPTGT